MRAPRGSAAQMRPWGSSISPVASTNSPGPSPGRPCVATCDPSAPKTRISCACESSTANPPPGSATRPLSAAKDSGRPPSREPTRSSSTSVNVGDGLAEGVLVTRMAPEGSVSRAVLQLEAGPADSQAGMATRRAARKGIAVARGLLLAAFMVSLASRARAWPAGNGLGRYAIGGSTNRQGCRSNVAARCSPGFFAALVLVPGPPRCLPSWLECGPDDNWSCQNGRAMVA